MTRQEVYALIDEERNYQDRERSNAAECVAEYLTIIQVLLREASADVYDRRELDALGQVRKIAAVAVRCMEVCGVLAREEAAPDGN